MRKLVGTMLAVALLAGLSGPARAQDANAVLDKAIQALGGQEKLAKVKAISWTGKGTLSFMGSDNPVTIRTVIQDLDHARQEFEGNIGGMQIKGATILAGDKGWREFAGMKMELDKNALADEKRATYLLLIPVTILPVRGTGFKVESAPDEKIGDKPAAVIKVTPPDGKEFTLYFDKESGLPVREAGKVAGFTGETATQETNFSDYKEMAGIKKATKTSSKRDGEKFIDQEISDFKILDTVDPKTFAEP